MKEIDDFLEELVNKKNLSNYTIMAYEKDLNDFIDFIQDKNLDFLKLSEEDFKSYFNFIKESYKLSTLKRKYSSVKNFYTFLWHKKYINKIFICDLDKSYKKIENKNLETISSFKSENKISFQEFIENLKDDNLHDMRLKVISLMIAELGITLANIFEIQIKDLLKYDFKKIIIKRNGKIYDYDPSEKVENTLKNYYETYVFEKRFLFSSYNIQAFRKDLSEYNLVLSDLKKALLENEDDIQKNIKKIYFEIGIGDE